MHLRGQQHLAVAAPAGFLDQRPQQRTPSSTPAPRLEHRHPADVAVGKEASGADGAAIPIGDGVDAARVVLVELELGGNALLVDEDLEADRFRFGLSGWPVEKADFYHRWKRIKSRRKKLLSDADAPPV